MISQQTIIYIVIGSVAAMLILGGLIIGAVFIIRPKVLLRKRMNQIGMIGDGGASDKAESRRQKRIQEKVKQLEQKSRKQSRLEALRSQIMQAGLDINLGTYFVFSAIIGVFASLGYLLTGLPPLGAVPVLLIGAFLVPKLLLGSMADRRQRKFTRNFADAVDLIVRGIRSGLPINECFRGVAREFEPPLGEEFRLLVEGQNLGWTIDDLMARGIQRLPTAEYKFFAIVTQIQRQTGGNLADTLSNLSTVLRERKKMRDKAQAMASEAKASAMIIGSLPFAVAWILSVVNPAYLMLLFTEKTGNYLLGFGAFWMTLGSLVMRKMINFKM
ncbi:MAG: type II secretion system F family protein [Rhodospirillales bacterium]|nr:type II secretion system F family protein [Rhodospirillales bacterium]